MKQVFIWPQIRRAVKTVESVAALTVLGGLLVRTAGTAFGAIRRDVPLILGNVTVATGFLVILLLILRHAQRPVALLAGAAGVGAVPFHRLD